MSIPNAPALTAEEERPRTLEEAKAWMRDKTEKRIHPMNNLSLEDTMSVVDGLMGLDGATWAAAWGAAGEGAFAAGEAAAASGDQDSARKQFQRAHGFFFMGRFPCPNHPDKLRNAARERDAYLKLGAMMDPPIEKIVVPFAGKAGEGSEVVFYLRRPKGVANPPVVMMWGGVDAWKEQMTVASDLVLARGVATIAMDGPGTGESPVKGVQDGERQFVPVFDWIDAQPDLVGKPGLLGRSFGGYWATRLAYLHKDRVSGAVNWGGGAHYMFQEDWIGRSRYPDSYLMELVETRQRMLGVDSWEGYIAGFAALSLLDQGLLDGPSAPMLLTNGREDKQCPVADIDLLVGHGSPKAVRMWPGGHMGPVPLVLPVVADWVCAQAKASAHP